MEGAGMSRRTNWQVPADVTAGVILVVRCRGHRILGLLNETPEPIVAFAGREPSRFGRILDGATVVNKGISNPEWASNPYIECPNHKSGHVLDGAKLRQVVDIQCRRGRIINVDLGRVAAE